MLRLTGILALSILAATGASAQYVVNPQWPNNQVSGTVTWNGAPLAGVFFTAVNTNTSTIMAHTTTDQNGNYTLQFPAWLNTAGDTYADYQFWVEKDGFGFYPSLGPGSGPDAEIIRTGYRGLFMGNGVTDIAINWPAIHYVAKPDPADRGKAGPPSTNVNFIAYDGTNPNLTLAPRTASSARYTDNGDGTITDSVTGLIWLKNASCFAPSNWNNALTAAGALANGACGLSDGSKPGDWRMPNVNELESLIDVSASSPAVSTGHPFSGVSSQIYWSSTSYYMYQNGSGSAWAIRFADGRYINDGVTNLEAVALNQLWPVKGSGSGAHFQLASTGAPVSLAPGDDLSTHTGIPAPFPRWIDKNDGTILDTATGLVWLKQADCINDTWSGAITAVRNLSSGQCGLADQSSSGDWHLPSRAEMLSLSDRSENNEADYFNSTYRYWDGSLFQAAVFNNFQTYQYYWTSDSDATDPTRAWTLFSCDYGVYDSAKMTPGFTLAVRSATRNTAPPQLHAIVLQ